MKRAFSALALAGLGPLLLPAAPAGAQITLDELGDRLAQQNPDGLTILTHGFQLHSVVIKSPGPRCARFRR